MAQLGSHLKEATKFSSFFHVKFQSPISFILFPATCIVYNMMIFWRARRGNIVSQTFRTNGRGGEAGERTCRASFALITGLTIGLGSGIVWEAKNFLSVLAACHSLLLLLPQYRLLQEWDFFYTLGMVGGTLLNSSNRLWPCRRILLPLMSMIASQGVLQHLERYSQLMLMRKE